MCSSRGPKQLCTVGHSAKTSTFNSTGSCSRVCCNLVGCACDFCLCASCSSTLCNVPILLKSFTVGLVLVFTGILVFMLHVGIASHLFIIMNYLGQKLDSR